jgi:hypothetical protein
MMEWMRRNPLMTVVYVVVALVTLDLALMVSGYRILVGEERGYTTIVPGSVSFGFVSEGIGYGTIECSYFTGRSVQITSDRVDAIDECPAIIRPYADAMR